jgi:hypothetical protein
MTNLNPDELEGKIWNISAIFEFRFDRLVYFAVRGMILGVGYTRPYVRLRFVNTEQK